MKGYFGIGVEGISKPMNAGALFRTAHAFGAAFVFTVGAAYARAEADKADTSKTAASLPLYEWPTLSDMRLPERCSLVGIELIDGAEALPSFRHPRRAAYVLGPERGALSPALCAACDFVVQIPTRFCVNLSVAGAIVMYDRLISSGRFAQRPMVPGGAAEPLPEHHFGAPVLRRRRASGKTKAS
jgi:tRNA G18 (ribose-2'-O)-methylase SpoU